MPGGFCITDQITDQYAPYCSELRYAVSIDYIELAVYWRIQQEMNTLSVRHKLPYKQWHIPDKHQL